MGAIRTTAAALCAVLSLAATGAGESFREHPERLGLGAAEHGEALEWAGAPGAAGGPGLALRAAKVLTAAREGHGVLDGGVVLVREGRIEAAGTDLEIPAGYRKVDLGRRWLIPGLVDLHSHVGGSRDYNDMVYQTNPGLRISCAVVPGWPDLRRALAGGVTTVLFIPGSGTNIGGQGVLIKTGLESFEAMRLRDPGSLKIAQGDNPTRWAYGMGRGLMNFHIRSALRRGRAYAAHWQDYQRGGGEPPRRDLTLEPFRDLFAHRTQISTHTQYYQLVLTSITMLRGEFGLDVYIDHGTFDGYRTAPLAEELGVPAVIGPRQISRDSRRFPNDRPGSVVGCAAEYQRRAHGLIGFNTDAPVVPAEELALQSAMGVRYGFRNDSLQAVRGITIVPATVAGIADRVGSIEPGKDADLVVISGDPSDPRSAVERVLIDGRTVYQAGTLPGGRPF